MKKIKNCVLMSLFLVLTSCGAFFNQPLKVDNARLGENTTNNKLIDGVLPVKPIVVGVYKFRDQTGQYKLVENGASWSTAVTQGGTSILLKSLEDSKWFTPIERENVSNLLNERQIIRSTRQEYAKNKTKEQTTSIPPLLFAGVLLEGGVVSYDSNIITGGSGARYFGAGGSVKYRQDRITIYLRAVSTSNGQILKTVYISKTILSQGISANLFRYVNLKRLLEVETGVTKNEPTQLAVKEAIDKAVETLIVEGVIDGLWKPQGGQADIDKIKGKYLKEKEAAESTVLLNRKLADKRGKLGFSIEGVSAIASNDYSNPEIKPGGSFALKYYLNPGLNLKLGAGYFELGNEGAYQNEFLSYDLSIGYDFLPYDNLTPFLYAGVGSAVGLEPTLKEIHVKLQYGGGIEYLPTNKFGIKVFAEQNFLMDDDIEGLVQGKLNDFYWRIGVGLNFYFGKPYNRVKSVIFE